MPLTCCSVPGAQGGVKNAVRSPLGENSDAFSLLAVRHFSKGRGPTIFSNGQRLWVQQGVPQGQVGAVLHEHLFAGKIRVERGKPTKSR